MTLTCSGVNDADYTHQYITLDIRTNTKIPTLNACKITSNSAANSGNNGIIVAAMERSYRAIDGQSVAATKRAMAVMERTVEERTQLERTVDMTQSERSYRASYG